MTKKMRWLAAMLAVIAMLGAACGGGDATDDPTGVETTGNPTDEPTDEPGGTATLTLADFEFEPADLTVASGTTLTLDNSGEAPHTFTLTDGGIDEEVAAGESGEVTIDLDAGTYDYVCTFHEAQGMVGTLTVE